MGSRRDCFWPKYPHPRCASCDAFLTRGADHIHVYDHKASEGEAVCGRCWSTINVAAIAVLRALQVAGGEPSAAGVVEALSSGAVQVFAQKAFLPQN